MIKSKSKIISGKIRTNKCCKGSYYACLSEEYFTDSNGIFSKEEVESDPIYSDAYPELEFLMKLHYEISQELFNRLLKIGQKNDQARI